MQLEINGSGWELSWGSGALESLCDDLGIGLQDIEYAIMVNETKMINRLTYAALVNGAEILDRSVDFNYKYFLFWLDQQPDQVGSDIMADFMKSKLLGQTMQARFNEIIERINANNDESEMGVTKKKTKRIPLVKS